MALRGLGQPCSLARALSRDLGTDAFSLPRFAAFAFAGLVLVYAAGWVVLALVAQLSRRAAEMLVWYQGLAWELPTIAVGLSLVVLSVRRNWLSTVWCPLLFVIVGGLWLARVADVLSTGGLFAGAGLDFGLYWAQARVLVEDTNPSAIYDTQALRQAMAALEPYARSAGGGLVASPVPYPPLFAWILSPLARLEPPIALLVWTSINVAGALWLAWRVGQCFAGRARLIAFVATLLSVPVAMAITLGQPIVLLACAFAEFYLSLEAGKDVRAGLWLSLLMFKPLYGAFIGPYLIWKRRWRAVVAAVAGVVAFIALSVVSVGPAAFAAYPNALDGVAAFYGESLSYPSLMINWRSLVVTLFGFLPDQAGLVLTLVLSLLTVAIAAWSLGRLQSTSTKDLPVSITAVTLTTLLASYHSNVHGAALLCLPLAALLARGRPSHLTRALLAALVLVPFAALFDVVFATLTGRGPWPPLQWSPFVPLLLGAALLGVLRDARQSSADQPISGTT